MFRRVGEISTRWLVIVFTEKEWICFRCVYINYPFCNHNFILTWSMTVIDKVLHRNVKTHPTKCDFHKCFFLIVNTRPILFPPNQDVCRSSTLNFNKNAIKQKLQLCDILVIVFSLNMHLFFYLLFLNE